MSSPIGLTVIADALTTIYTTETVTVTGFPTSAKILISKRSESNGLVTYSNSFGVGTSKNIGLAIGITIGIVALIILGCGTWYFLRRRKMIKSRYNQQSDNFHMKDFPTQQFEHQTTFDLIARPEKPNKDNEWGSFPTNESVNTLQNHWTHKASKHVIELMGRAIDEKNSSFEDAGYSDDSSLSTGKASEEQKLPQLNLKNFRLAHHPDVSISKDRGAVRNLSDLEDYKNDKITRQVALQKTKRKKNILQEIDVFNTAY